MTVDEVPQKAISHLVRTGARSKSRGNDETGNGSREVGVLSELSFVPQLDASP